MIPRRWRDGIIGAVALGEGLSAEQVQIPRASCRLSSAARAQFGGRLFGVGVCGSRHRLAQRRPVV